MLQIPGRGEMARPLARKCYQSHEDGDQHTIPGVCFHDDILDPEATVEQLPKIHQVRVTFFMFV
jgi:hypothetical protein